MRVILSGLRTRGIPVHECTSPLFRDTEEKLRLLKGIRGLLALPWRVISSYVRLAAQFVKAPQCNAVIVGYGGILDGLWLRVLMFLTRRRALVVTDAFISVYDTIVLDRQLCGPKSLKARLARWYDWLVCASADVVMLDTQRNIDFFVENYKFDQSRFERVWVGSDKRPEEVKCLQAGGEYDGAFNVLFWGAYIPLHGIDTIVRAAALLDSSPGIRLTVIGDGQLSPAIEELVSELKPRCLQRLPRLNYRELNEQIATADLCLGIFGTTTKASRVIPCKVFDALAFGKPVITGDTEAARELLTDGEDVRLVPCGSPEALAAAVIELRSSAAVRERIAAGASKTFKQKCTDAAIGRLLTTLMEKHLAARRMGLSAAGMQNK